MTTTLEWFGTATFRVRHAGLDLFFDAYLDRLPGLAPVGLSTAEVDKADFVFVSHAHFDHLYGADAIALRTGAVVVASPESAHCLRASGVPEEQLLVVTGGETVQCGPDTTVRVLPGPALLPLRPQRPRHRGGLPGRPRRERPGARRHHARPLRRHGRRTGAGRARAHRHERGVLPPRRRTTGLPARRRRAAPCWSAAARATGGASSTACAPTSRCSPWAAGPTSTASRSRAPRSTSCSSRCSGCGAGRVAFCHHDPLFPGLPGVDIEPAAAALQVPGAPSGYFALEYATPVPILG